MDSKKAILGFQFTERIKSLLFLAASTSSAVMGMKGEQAEGGFITLRIIVGTLTNDIEMASSMLQGDEKIKTFLKDADQLVARLDIRDFQDINNRLGRLISQISTFGQEFLEYLLEHKLL